MGMPRGCRGVRMVVEMLRSHVVGHSPISGVAGCKFYCSLAGIHVIGVCIT